VRLERADPAVVDTLRSQQQVHGQRPAEPPDHHEQVDEVAVRGQQLTELVDHHEQGGQRVERRPLRAGAFVVEDRAVAAGRAQLLLAPDQLAVQRVLHAADQRGLVGQVGDDG
jgi:hypothetical protein